MSYADKCLDAMTYEGNRFKHAWLMALACYAYTRSWDGAEANDQGERYSFGRWYSFTCAVSLGWDHLWRTPQ